MIATKETVKVRLEIEFEILAGELRTLEEDVKRMSLTKVLEVWGPETNEARFMLHLIYIGEERSE